VSSVGLECWHRDRGELDTPASATWSDPEHTLDRKRQCVICAPSEIDWSRTSRRELGVKQHFNAEVPNRATAAQKPPLDCPATMTSVFNLA
jgi:hypothetical protein